MAWIFSKALIDSANSPSLQAVAAGFSPDDSLAGELYAPSSSTNTQPACSWQGKTTDASIRFRSGMTFALSTADRGEDVLTSFLEGFPARTFQPQEREPESTASDPGCGPKWPASLAKYDPDSRSWKTRQCLLLGGLDEFSETWPKWGTTRGGVAYRQGTPSGLLAIRAYITSAKGSGLSLPTPGAAKAGNDVTLTCSGDGRAKPNKLGWAVAKIPTPHGLSNSQGQGGGEFDKAVRKLGTATASNTVRSKKFARATESPRESVNGGQLNPTWVEWFMGWPIDWTDLRPLAMDKFQAWLDSHGESWPASLSLNRRAPRQLAVERDM